MTVVKENQQIVIHIEGMGRKGNPFVKIRGFVIFISDKFFNGVKLDFDDKVKIEIVKVYPKFAIAKVVDLLKVNTEQSEEFVYIDKEKVI